MESKNKFSFRLSLTIVIIIITLQTCTATFIKKPIHSQRHNLRHKRQALPSHFFAQNVSFGLQDPPPGTEFGPWGPWTESSECSRSCGGGIAHQDRICLDVRPDGRHSCIGASRRYFSCNIQDCPEGSKDFREEQCARFNTVPYEQKYFAWVPHYKAQNPCELNCMPKGERFYTRLSRKVIDGTRCYNDGTLDVCIDGFCTPMGCDMMLGSTAKEDVCRECGGDGSSCRTISGIFDEDEFTIGYNDILVIPSGATSIHIRESQPTNNYLAIRNLAGEFFLNGNWRIEVPHEIRFAGTVFHYERDARKLFSSESLRALGPTIEPIFIVLLYQEQNLGISYEYSIPIGVSTLKPESYSWSFGDFEECSQTCGGGMQHRSVQCIRNSDREIVAEGLCDPSRKPATNASCNSQPCPAGWQIGEWTNCSEPCGGGTQFRLVFCHQLKGGDIAALVSEELCEEPKPLFMRACNDDVECPQWSTGEWSDCNKTCGQGYRSRDVECVSQNNGTVVDNAQCKTESKPNEVEECSMGPCEGVEWILSEWSGCDGLCSPRMESREAHCANEEGEVFPDEACDANRLPELSRTCPMSSMCEPMWHTSEWTECSVTCGTGVQTRVVFCGVWEQNSVIKIDESKCVAEKKFTDMQNCSSTACEGLWFTGPWNRCSVPCGGGEKSRKVLCFHEDKAVPEIHCDSNERPFEKEPCNMDPCDEDEVIMVEGCKNFKYGCCPDGVTPAGNNFEGCPKMNISSNETCDTVEFGCCADGYTLALGPYKKGCPEVIVCNNTSYGCCPDGVSVAEGPDNEGCFEVGNCTNSTFGCCPDGITAALDDDFGGCNITEEDKNCTNSTSLECMSIEFSGEDCTSSEFGCCADGITPASGPDQEGCEEILIIDTAVDCSESEFGCCEDNVTTAKGYFYEGCFEDEGSGSIDDTINCNETFFGCCPDNKTASKGLDNEGCDEITDCAASEFGCCDDNVTFAVGPDYLGCENGTVLCNETEYGCCADNITVASGPDGEGCDLMFLSCNETEFGCCKDNITAALGPDGEGCNITSCFDTIFGCCPDNKTAAMGSFGEGCKEIEDCSNTTYGCCPDNVTVALSSDYDGCPNTTNCTISEFGCCLDGISVAIGPDFEGCENKTSTEVTYLTTEETYLTTEETYLTTLETTTVEEPSPECINSLFGCCPDMRTIALGPNLEGCCFGLRFGCCPDNKTAALGPTFLGCSCHTYPYGCCPDGLSPAQGPRYHGCSCEHFRYGCCRDGIAPAAGPNFEGCTCKESQYGCCPDGITSMLGENGEGCGCSSSSRYGCCPDGKTPAVSADLTGCPCDTLPYGCCPDGRTPARTSDPRDCPCDRQLYGCCLDGITPALGPNYEGCPCDSTRFGCCLDGKTTAAGPDFEGCPCSATRFGCCADGHTQALGPNLEGCPRVQPPDQKISAEVCSLPKEPGPCQNYSVRWFFDVKYGGCSRFWYGGCDGNGNVFNTQENCEKTCVTPEGADACLLPKVSGPCDGSYHSWYYDVGSKTCESFKYSGCLGNNNRFTSKELCEHTCIMHEPMLPVDVCTLSKDEGPCDRITLKWYFNSATKKCEQFYYGGCKGNGNKFDTRSACENSCVPSTSTAKDICRLPQEMGTCYNFRERWYYDYELGQCHRFYYSGCEGNENNFATFHECDKRCGKEASAVTVPWQETFRIEFCALDKDPGPCSETELHWYYDKNDGVCKEFYYGGCQGNGNRFKTRKDCESACEPSQDICSLPVVKGPCSGSFTQWYYDHSSDECFEFQFSGCQGNANRFNSQQKCHQRCKKHVVTTQAISVLDNVCTLPQEPGPCLGYYRMWYYESSENICKSFVYGGCDGNENRFEKRSECEHKCVRKTAKVVTVPPVVVIDPSKITNEDVCRLSVDPGPCNDAHARWFYDAQSQSCLPFVYGGCGGNKNRFKTPEICLKFCTGIKATPEAQQPAPPTTSTTTTTTVIPRTCPPSSCGDIQCPFGIEESTDAEGCTSCRCSNPCEAYSCPVGSRCSIDIVRTPNGGTRTEPVCRKKQKSGDCPVVHANELNMKPLSNRDCNDRCRDDADCRGDHKCCNNGCANVCMQPEDVNIPSTQPEAARILPGPNVTKGRIGEPSELPCRAVGYPKPSVTWWRESTMLPLSSRRYEQRSDYTLLIRSVIYEDRGEYSCQAYNGIGPGDIFIVTLVIDVYSPHPNNQPSIPRIPNITAHSAADQVKSPSNVFSEPETNNGIDRTIDQDTPTLLNEPLSARVSLIKSEQTIGSLLHIDCTVQGPVPGTNVAWYFKGKQILNNGKREILSNNTLLVKNAEISDSGEYTCVARHGNSIASSSVSLIVKDASIDEKCIDNPQFANCELIVKAKYCNNIHYGKYCCASCMKAGQLHKWPIQ